MGVASAAPLLVAHARQVQPLRRRHRTAGAAIPSLQGGGDVGLRPAPDAHLGERARSSSAPAGAGTSGWRTPGSPRRPRGARPPRPASCTGDFAWQARSRKVVKSWWPTSTWAACVHGLGVQRLLHVPDPALVQRRRAAPVEDAVAVAPLGGREPGVPALRRDAWPPARRPAPGSGGRSAHCARSRRGQSRVEVHMHHLAGGVDAGVGAARGLQPELLAAEGLDGALDRALHRRRAPSGPGSRDRAGRRTRRARR